MCVAVSTVRNGIHRTAPASTVLGNILRVAIYLPIQVRPFRRIHSRIRYFHFIFWGFVPRLVEGCAPPEETSGDDGTVDHR